MYRWNFEPSLIIGLLGQAFAYLACVGVLRSYFPGSEPVPLKQKIIFLCGTLTLFVALVSPLDKLGEGYLFTMHMLQHMLVTLLAPPLLLIGTPKWLFRPILRVPFALPIGRVVTNPIVTFIVFNFLFAVWHLPFLYDLTLRNQYVHIFEHSLFIGAATLTWWPIFSPLDELPAASMPVQILYLFFQSLPAAILGAIITFADSVLYPTYANAPRIWDLSPIQDQRFAGLLMWIPGGLVYFTVLSVLFLRWFSMDDRDPVPVAR